VIPLREALSRLAAIGLVDVEDQKGFSVSSVSLADLEDITRARVQIECLALRQAIERGDIDWETRVIAAHHRLSRLSQTDPHDSRALDRRWESLHRELHVALVSGCGSPWLMHFQGVLADQSVRYRRLAVAVRQHKRDVRAEHEGIVSATLARDSKRACESLTAHYQMTADTLRSHAAELFQSRNRGARRGPSTQRKRRALAG
jgi:DNA-binding GntR family transcriptional regulator